MTLHLDGSEPTLSLHGWLAGPEVEEFERVVASRVLTIDLRYLMGVDREGAAALRAERDYGSMLLNASAYIELLLEAAELDALIRTRGGRTSHPPPLPRLRGFGSVVR